jgi:hypothetical protein
MSQEHKKCKACMKILHGRSDKKFCNDYCRNSYNNQLNPTRNNLVRKINNVLIKNRKILEKILGQAGTRRSTKEQLYQAGFQFQYKTHSYCNREGSQYHYCYDYGYMELGSDWYLIVKRKEGPSP